MTRLRARHYLDGRPLELTLDHGRIAAMEPIADEPDLPCVAPAFFDLQINGGGGHGFTSETLTTDSIRAVVYHCRRHGIGQLCPTLITNSFHTLRHGLTTLRNAVESDPALSHTLPAFHLEGPYISAEDGPRGAHPREHVRAPDWDEFRRFQEAAGGRIRLITLAPEHELALPIIEKLVASGVIVALGHTAAMPARIRDAVRAGARLSTHLGNGCAGMLNRHENVIWEQLACDELWASVICDGHHLPPAVVKSIIRSKTAQRIILTCDASSLAGLPPGRYREWEQELEITSEGRIGVVGQHVLAGSWHFTDTCIGNVMRFAGVSLAQAIAMATDHPRDLLGLPVPRVEAGGKADLVVLRSKESRALEIGQVIIDGARILSDSNQDRSTSPA